MKGNGAGRGAACRQRELERKIHELESTLQLIEESRSHYADQYDFAPYGCMTLDSLGCILELNIAAGKLLGRERARLVGRPLFPFVTRSHLPAFFNHLQKCKRSREKVVSEIAFCSRGKAHCLVEFCSVPVLDTHTSRTVYRTALQDITDRNRIEQTLRQSEERFSTVFHASPTPIVITTFDEGRFIDVNSSFCALTGYSRDEVIGRTTLELGFLPTPAMRKKLLADLGKAGDLKNIEIQTTTKSGDKRDMLISAGLIKLEDKACILLIGRDVTELKQLQREVLEISEREQARIGRDLHDGACQSLVGLATLAEVAARDLSRADSKTTARMREISRLARQSVDDVQHLASGLFPVKFQGHGLDWALQDLAVETRLRSHVECRFIMRQPVAIADHNAIIHLYRIAQEAINNALHHGHATDISLELDGLNGTFRLVIQDNGKGLPRRPKKSGLGLHIMAYRARMLGGSLEISPVTTCGTTVICSFPGENL